MKKFSLVLVGLVCMLQVSATIHVIRVWDGYYQFLPSESGDIYLGDTIQWLPFDFPSMVHTVTSTNIPNGALAFDQIWKAPRDTFFQYVPTISGIYNYECTPHADSWNMFGSFTVLEKSNSVWEGVDTHSVSLYPNPASNEVFVQTNGKEMDYSIYGLDGKKYMMGKTNHSISVSMLPKGVYLVELVGVKPQVIKLSKE